ncbi:unnamed protein product [Cyclocybe aegerita]|uniref:Uncharacterized protein n=1 Tax=Cyclocybe aegerita TaxID=1973307 RepID=A0A8S0WTC3_CYCAE|nr:unnamed protein product [Cyclocybe aegerita]
MIPRKLNEPPSVISSVPPHLQISIHPSFLQTCPEQKQALVIPPRNTSSGPSFPPTRFTSDKARLQSLKSIEGSLGVSLHIEPASISPTTPVATSTAASTQEEPLPQTSRTSLCTLSSSAIFHYTYTGDSTHYPSWLKKAA